MQTEIHLELMQILEAEPQISQRDLAQRLGLSLGKINYCIKALRDKGFLKYENFSKNPHKVQYLYLLTPLGMKEKIFLTRQFLKRKEQEYDELQITILRLREQLAAQTNKAKL